MSTTKNESESAGEEREVSPMELFYDLVFVFAVSQLSHHLLANTTARGLLETTILLVAVFTVWVLTSFEATYFDTTRGQTQTAILVAMGLGLFMNAAIPEAFTGGSWAFALPLVITQIARGILTATSAPTPQLRTHYRHLLGWVAASTPLRIVGAAVDTDARLWWWLAAALVDVSGVWLAHPVPGRRTVVGRVRIDGAHMTERLRLFLLIALGEVVVTTGTAIAEAPTRLGTVVAGAASFVVIACLWGLYFGGRPTMTSVEAPSEKDPVWLARMGANGQYLVLAGLIGVAVAAERIVGEPAAEGSPQLSALLFGGLVLYLGTHTWYLAIASTGQRLRPRWATCALLVGAGLIATRLPALAAITLACLTLAPLTVHTIRSRRRHPTIFAPAPS